MLRRVLEGGKGREGDEEGLVKDATSKKKDCVKNGETCGLEV